MNLAIPNIFSIFAKLKRTNRKNMGRLLFVLLVIAIVLLLILLVNTLSLRRGKRITSHDEKRKSFDRDIEAVAKEIQKLNKHD